MLPRWVSPGLATSTGPSMRRSDDGANGPGAAVRANPTVRSLSVREQQIARLVGQGLKDAVIARRLGLSVATVGNYVTHIRQRLKLDSRAEIATWVTARLNPNVPTGRLRRLDGAPGDAEVRTGPPD